jgi:RNA 3'-terminal phosphate cyclase (ATP)
MREGMLNIDGSMGEGGGQLLRSSLTLSLLTGTGFRMRSIRERRARPGLLPQHLASVRAAATVSCADVQGEVAGSRELVFQPGRVVPGDYTFEVGTAGSAILVLQTVLLPLALAGAPSTALVRGGTHNPQAPPFEHLAHAWLPSLRSMGLRATAHLDRHGFYPAGGGAVRCRIEPLQRLLSHEWLERGPVVGTEARAILSGLPERIAARELNTIYRELGWGWDALITEQVPQPVGFGNALVATVRCANACDVFSAVGERGIRAERVAASVAVQVRDFLQAGVPVGPQLCDQLILPLALAGGGAMRTMRPTAHATSQLELAGIFLGVKGRFEQESEQAWRCTVG